MGVAADAVCCSDSIPSGGREQPNGFCTELNRHAAGPGPALHMRRLARVAISAFIQPASELCQNVVRGLFHVGCVTRYVCVHCTPMVSQDHSGQSRPHFPFTAVYLKNALRNACAVSPALRRRRPSDQVLDPFLQCDATRRMQRACSRLPHLRAIHNSHHSPSSMHHNDVQIHLQLQM